MIVLLARLNFVYCLVARAPKVKPSRDNYITARNNESEDAKVPVSDEVVSSRRVAAADAAPEPEPDEDVDVDKKTLEAREWDNWKDENPRGAGNKMGKM